MSMQHVTDQPVPTHVDGPMDLFSSCGLNTTNSDLFCTMSAVMGIVSIYCFPIFSGFGVITNFLVVYVFLLRFKKVTRQMIYLSALALADNLNMISIGWMWFFPAKGLPYTSWGRYSFFTYNQGELVCKIHRFFNYFASCLACNFFVLTAVDRCLSIYFPFKFASMSKNIAWICVGSTLIGSVFLMLVIPIVMGYSVQGGRILCGFYWDSLFLQIFSLLFANCGLLQTSLLILINIALLLKIVSIQSERRQLQATTANTGSSKEIGREVHASLILLILSSVYMVCSSVIVVGSVMAFYLQYYSHNADGGAALRLAYNVYDLGFHLFFVQQSTSWLVYMSRMKEFRNQTFRVFGCTRWIDEKGSGGAVSVSTDTIK